MVRLRQRAFADAALLFGAAARAEPEFVEAVNNLGVASDLAGQPQAAAEAFARALQLRPQMQEAACNLCIAKVNLWCPPLPPASPLPCFPAPVSVGSARLCVTAAAAADCAVRAWQGGAGWTECIRRRSIGDRGGGGRGGGDARRRTGARAHGRGARATDPWRARAARRP
jgi:hypothetical protein